MEFLFLYFIIFGIQVIEYSNLKTENSERERERVRERVSIKILLKNNYKLTTPDWNGRECGGRLLRKYLSVILILIFHENKKIFHIILN